MDELADLDSVKVLANPLRQRILRQLTLDGEATSTTLAAKLGVTTGGTSYNLRILAEHGFVEEVPERASGRERWWRSAKRSLRFPPHGEQSPAMRAAMDELNQLWLERDFEALSRFLGARDTLGEWSDALPYSRGSMRVTLDELREFFEEYLALLYRFQRPNEEVPADARTVLTYFVAFPEIPEN
jgi:DNA-binding transcriptional ArsR family regulator